MQRQFTSCKESYIHTTGVVLVEENPPRLFIAVSEVFRMRLEPSVYLTSPTC